MATAGNTATLGPGLYCASDSLAATNPDWTAVAAGTIIYIHRVNAVGVGGATLGSITLTDAGGTNYLFDTFPVSNASGIPAPLSVNYGSGRLPKLNGMKIVTTAVASNTIAYSIVYSTA